MELLADIIVSVGFIIAVLGACGLDSPGIYGYIAGIISMLGFLIGGIGVCMRSLDRHSDQTVK